MLAWEWVPVVEVLACIVPLRMAPTELILLSVPKMMMVKLSNRREKVHKLCRKGLLDTCQYIHVILKSMADTLWIETQLKTSMNLLLTVNNLHMQNILHF